MKRQLQQGFTLIELMIVVAIIGILAAVAIPQYQDYVTRSRWSDPITQISSIKLAIAECTQTTGALSNCSDAAALSTAVGFSTPTSLGNASVTWGSSQLTLIGNSTLGSCTVTFVPAQNAAAMTWTATTTGTGCSKTKTGV